MVLGEAAAAAILGSVLSRAASCLSAQVVNLIAIVLTLTRAPPPICFRQL